MKSRTKNRIKRLLTWSFPLVLVCGGGFAISAYLQTQEQQRLHKVYKEREVTASRQDIRKILYLTGKVLPSSAINIYSPVSGQITDILVKEGDRVTANQPLFSVKQDSTGQKELESRYNDVNRARLELREAEENLSRIRSVGDLFSVSDRQKSEIDFQRKKLEYEAAVERLSLLEESLGLHGKNDRTKKDKSSLSTIFVTAPRDSFVTLIGKSIGDAVLGTTIGNQTLDSDVMTLSDVAQMIVRTKVLESDLELISVGKPVIIRLDAIKERSYKGHISRISQQGIEDKAGGFTYFLTDVSIEDQDAKVRAQMNASLQIFVAEKHRVLALPVDAVATSGEHSIVEGAPNAEEKLSAERPPDFRKVKVGLVGDDYVEILSDNVKEGEKYLKIDFATIDPKELASGKISAPAKDKGHKSRGGPRGG